MTNTRASVIVCAYTENRWADLQNAVASLTAQTIKPAEIIVVVDNNTALFEKARASLVEAKVIENNLSPGNSGARNAGAANATGEILAFIDDDAVAAPNWLEQVLSHYENPQVVAVGGMVQPNWDSSAPEWFPEEFFWVIGCSYRGIPTAVSRVRNLIACNMSIRTGVFQATRGFNVRIGQSANDTVRIGSRFRKAGVYCEETELCVRVTRHVPDGVILYDPSAKVLHRVPVSRQTLRYFAWRCYSEGLSKAQLSALLDKSERLSTEMAYTTRTLPTGVVRGVINSANVRNFNGLKKSAMICIGFGVTLAGYAVGRLTAAPQSRESKTVTELPA